MAVSKKTCFVISPIGQEGSDTRLKADEVFQYLIKPVVTDLGYEAVRADQIDESGSITTQIIQKLITSDLVIADLSERNPNVFYELSVRHFSRKPFIQIITSGETIPFDVAANRTIPYDLTRLSVAETAKSQIRAQIKGIEAGVDETENPISTAIDLSSLRASPSSADRTIGEMLATITEIAGRVAKIDQALSSKDRNRLEWTTKELESSRGQLMSARREIFRLRAIKQQLNFEHIDEAHKLHEPLEAIIEIVEQIRQQSLPNWKYSKDELDLELRDLVSKMKSILEYVVPF